MAILLPCIEFETSASEAVSLQRIAGWTLTAVGARLWLTEENVGRDIWLRPGDRHVVVGAGKVVVESWPATNAAADLPARVPPICRHGYGWRRRRHAAVGAGTCRAYGHARR